MPLKMSYTSPIVAILAFFLVEFSRFNMPAIFPVDFVPVDAELVHMPVVTIFRRTPIEAVSCWGRRNRFEARGHYLPLSATCSSKR